LLKDLGLGYFKQFTKGTAFFEPFSLAPPQKIDVPDQVPSYIIGGGSQTIIDTLAAQLSEEELLLDSAQRVVKDIISKYPTT